MTTTEQKTKRMATVQKRIDAALVKRDRAAEVLRNTELELGKLGGHLDWLRAMPTDDTPPVAGVDYPVAVADPDQPLPEL